MDKINSQDYWINETIALLALSLMKGVGYWTIRNLTIKGLSLKQVLKTNTREEFTEYLRQAGCKNANQLSETWENSIREIWQEAVKLYRDLKNQSIEIIHYGQEQFPQQLKEIDEAPQWLFVQGNISLLYQQAIAIVGTRQPSEDGKFLAKYIGGCLAYWKDAVTVSGLAYGIDQTIHQESIRFNIPTIAFLGTGILLNYPANSEKLRHQILEKGGTIVSEYLPSESYSAENFIRRNRLQAGLSQVVIPIEWKPKSGTAHTVRFAKAANRQLICLKLPDWSNLEHPELSVAQEMGAKIFTIPGEESELIKTVQKFIVDTPRSKDAGILHSSLKLAQPGLHQVE
jgi:DNA protecting protein DprA